MITVTSGSTDTTAYATPAVSVARMFYYRAEATPTPKRSAIPLPVDGSR